MSTPLSHTDVSFLRRFFTMIALMGLFLLILAFFAHWLNSNQPAVALPAIHAVGTAAVPASEAHP